MESVTSILEFKKTCVSYTKQTMAVKYVSAAIEKNTITAIMGPSGCGKSTLLRAVNLMHNLYPNIHVDGEILLNGKKTVRVGHLLVRRNMIRRMQVSGMVAVQLTIRPFLMLKERQQRR